MYCSSLTKIFIHPLFLFQQDTVAELGSLGQLLLVYIYVHVYSLTKQKVCHATAL